MPINRKARPLLTRTEELDLIHGDNLSGLKMDRKRICPSRMPRSRMPSRHAPLSGLDRLRIALRWLGMIDGGPCAAARSSTTKPFNLSTGKSA